MATGACGINCDVCQLNLLGHCSSCGPGRSDLATAKSAAQTRRFGHPCAILECARLNHIDYCPRDCPGFPCDNFTAAQYPYGKGFLEMQQRRRNQGPPAVDPSGRPIQISTDLWEQLRRRDMPTVANFTLTDIDPASGQICFRFLNWDILVDTHKKCLRGKAEQGWEKITVVLLELTVLEYFALVDRLFPMGREMVGPDDLAGAHYFRERGRLNTAALLARYGDDPNGFAAVGRHLGGQPEKMADVAFQLTPFPRIPLYYLLWLGSREFPPRISILFDRSIERALSSPAIWSLVTLCNYYLIKGFE
ncbi:hypothetical protein DSCO28_24690 [Desulfosarcina ovata subsp. sediminis]|uniref:DUF3786 domain-containing protein n=1 Tax=Desulfosarcina ovata subsp. sediminis TaxID=885957 RepID=A0A5K7ZRK1_9BACT|nr:DUF3786 domain-containing protein [Desulfosarcina ovata]BBO81903.1 hypothetical protein DSCO28_24690 [Desulfosarcina ovata subsp. sediminis]